MTTDPIKALVGLWPELDAHAKFADLYGLDMPQVTREQLETILAAIEALKPPASSAPVVPDIGATVSIETEAALKAIDDNIRKARANGNMLVGAPAPLLQP